MKKFLPIIGTLIVSIFLLIFGPSTDLDSENSTENLQNEDSSENSDLDNGNTLSENSENQSSDQVPDINQELIFTGEIIAISEILGINTNSSEPILNLKIKIIEEPGNTKDFFEKSQIGRVIDIEQDPNYLTGKFEFQENDKLLINYLLGTESYQILDYVRTPVLFWLLVIFIIIVVIVTKWQGIGSLIGMAFSFLVLFQLILPQMLNGSDPVFAVISGAVLIIPATFSLSHGPSRKTFTAVLGTLVTLIFTGILAKIFSTLANLSGLTSEEASFLSLEASQNINFKSLVLAGMIVGIIGILDDITISQASVVQQLKNAKDKITRAELFKRAMVVGKDHISSMVNTLVLIYAGASLPLLLLFLDYNEGFIEVINQEYMSQEIIETLVGSIGLILAVPFTTLLAIFLIKKNPHDKHTGCRH